MEPERDIEKELNAYAQQRRAAAGTPPPLHPGNRKSLQAEAAQLAKSPDVRPRSWWQTFFGSWPRLAIAGAAAIVVAIATVHWFFPPEAKQERFRSFAANRHLMEEPKAMRPAPPIQPPQTTVLAQKLSAEGEPQAAAPASTAIPAPDVAGTSVPIASALSPPAPAPVVSPAPGGSPPVARTLALNAPVAQNRGLLSSSGQLDKDANAFGSPPAATGGAIASSTEAFDRLTTADAPTMLVTQRFRRTDLPAKKAKSLSVSNLLASFKVEQDLGKLRVIDADGSVYFGFVDQAPGSNDPADAIFENKVSEKETVSVKSARPLQTFHFRVSGTNRTLKEEVIFTGNFLTGAGLTPQMSPATKAHSNAASATVAQPVLFELRKARLEGQLLLGGTNTFLIKAAPAKP